MITAIVALFGTFPPESGRGLAPEELALPAQTQAAEDPLRSIRTALRKAELEFQSLQSPATAEATLEEAARALLPSINAGQLAAKERLLAQDIWKLREQLVAKVEGLKGAHPGTWGPFAKAIGRAEASGSTSSQGITAIDAKVWQSLVKGDMAFVGQLGKRAVPGLLRFLRQQGAVSYAEAGSDPLKYLIGIDPLAADAFITELRAKGEPDLLWKIRFARVMGEINFFSRQGSWKTQTYFGDEVVTPAILDWCDDLLTTPECTGHVVKAFAGVVRRRVYPPGLRSYVEGVLASDLRVPSHVHGWFTSGHPHAPMGEIMLKGLDSPNQTVAQLAFGVLWGLDSNEGVYEALLRQPMPRRSRAASWLNERTVQRQAAPGAPSLVSQGSFRPEIGAAEKQFVDRLLNDKEDSVRASTLFMLTELRSDQEPFTIPSWPAAELLEREAYRARFPVAIEDSTLAQLAADESVDVRRRLAQLGHRLPLSQREFLAAAFASDPDVQVWGKALSIARYFSWDENPAQAIAATKEVVAKLPMEDLWRDLFSKGGQPRYPIDYALLAPSSYGEIADWVAREETPAGARFVLLNEEYDSLRKQAAELPADTWVKLLVLSSDRNKDLMSKWLKRRRGADACDASIRAVASGEVESPVVMSLLLGQGPHEDSKLDDEMMVKAWVNLMRAKVWGLDLSTHMVPYGGTLNASLTRYPEAVRVGVSRGLVAGDSPDLELAGQAFTRMGTSLVMDDSVIRAAVESTGRGGENVWLIRAVAGHMAKVPAAADIEWIARLTAREDTAAAALAAVEKLRDPRLLPAVAKIIEGPASAATYSPAVRALKGFLSDEAAELLLAAARKTPIENDRTFCLGQLEKIAALQDAEARWATRRMRAATREATVSRLLELLGDKDASVRVEAVRGLATWEAVEALPQLILLLKDEERTVAEAARAALDRLND